MKKGRVELVTRPQPTIYGNCDSWNFIVGTKQDFPYPGGLKFCSLQHHNRQIIHRISTIPEEQRREKLWVNCGLPVDELCPSHIVDWRHPLYSHHPLKNRSDSIKTDI
jgi:hypothetical protein